MAGIDHPQDVHDRDSFLSFVGWLIADRRTEIEKERANPSSPYGPGAQGWENTTIESFLEAAVAWAKDSDFGDRQGLSDENLWQRFATFLYCGKIYE